MQTENVCPFISSCERLVTEEHFSKYCMDAFEFCSVYRAFHVKTPLEWKRQLDATGGDRKDCLSRIHNLKGGEKDAD